MNPVLLKTFGGLSRQYLFRQFFFGVVIAIAFTYPVFNSGDNYSILLLAVINTLLYPYSRFVYESIVNFIMGDNVFFVNGIIMIVAKIFTMLMCWGFAIFIAPLGLIYLYCYHSKSSVE